MKEFMQTLETRYGDQTRLLEQANKQKEQTLKQT
jgi:hypothetical protein